MMLPIEMVVGETQTRLECYFVAMELTAAINMISLELFASCSDDNKAISCKYSSTRFHKSREYWS